MTSSVQSPTEALLEAVDPALRWLSEYPDSLWVWLGLLALVWLFGVSLWLILTNRSL